MNDTTYNGYANYETWNVALWLNNDEPLYHYMLDARPDDCTPMAAMSLVLNIMPGGTPDFDSVDDYERVNWSEIADVIREA